MAPKVSLGSTLSPIPPADALPALEESQLPTHVIQGTKTYLEYQQAFDAHMCRILDLSGSEVRARFLQGLNTPLLREVQRYFSNYRFRELPLMLIRRHLLQVADMYQPLPTRTPPTCTSSRALSLMCVSITLVILILIALSFTLSTVPLRIYWPNPTLPHDRLDG